MGFYSGFVPFLILELERNITELFIVVFPFPPHAHWVKMEFYAKVFNSSAHTTNTNIGTSKEIPLRHNDYLKVDYGLTREVES